MNVRVDKSFAKDTDKIKDQKLQEKIANIIERVQLASTIQEVSNLKKLKGESQYYESRWVIIEWGSGLMRIRWILFDSFTERIFTGIFLDNRIHPCRVKA